MTPTIERVSGLTAAGAGATPAPIYGTYLTTHGILALSFAECIQILGATYVAFLLIKGISSLIKSTVNKFK